jgi:hypothetical protein
LLSEKGGSVAVTEARLQEHVRARLIDCGERVNKKS